MSAPESYTRFVAERAQLPPLTSGDIRYWDGLGLASHGLKLPSRAESGAPTAVPAQARAVPRHRDRPCRTLRSRSLLPALPPPVFDWTTEAACLTLYVDPDLFVASPTPWSLERLAPSCGSREAYGACLSSCVHSALLVQTVSTTCQGACVEIVPHLPVDDPLRHHMELALQTAFEAEGVTGRLYARVVG